MILLIRYKGAGGTLRGSKFKFHYDSINSGKKGGRIHMSEI